MNSSAPHRLSMVFILILRGKRGKKEKSFYVDALSDDRRIVVEVEAGRAYANYQFLKDIFEASMMSDVKYLILAVRNRYRNRKDYSIIHT